MKSAWYERQGPAREVLHVGTLPDPEPGPGEVRVRVALSGLNPSDIKTRTGFAGKPLPFPRIVPHQDGAGTIDRVGAGVPSGRIGERVWLYEAQADRPAGTAAEYVVLPAARAVALPDGVPFEVGACLGVPALTAHRCLFADGELRGKRVLVQGGAGAVGSAAIQLAKWAGAWVAANIDTAIACLGRDGVAAAYSAEDPRASVAIPFMRALRAGLGFRFVYVYTMPEAAKRQAIADITACLAAGAYRPAIAATLPLERIAEAHEAQESGCTIGKILLAP